jgi:hypothetical protein
MKTKLSKACSMYGSQMGRPNMIPSDIETASKLYLEKLEWQDGDYDKGGAYWGRNGVNHVYRASGESATEQIEIFVRAMNREEAKTKTREVFSNAKFFR